MMLYDWPWNDSLVMCKIEAFICWFWLLTKIPACVVDFQFQRANCPASDLLNSSMLEAESGLGQNMKVVANGVKYLRSKFQLNLSTVACEMIKIPLTAKCTVLRTVFYFP